MNLDQTRTRLVQERQRLDEIHRSLSQVASEAGSEPSTGDQHPADAGTDTFERSKDLAILERMERQLTEVDHALDRLETGRYGVCEACGEPIGAPRLRARPAARLCLRDQELAEEEEAAPRSSPSGSA